MSLTVSMNVTELSLTVEQNGNIVNINPVITKSSESSNIDGGNASTNF